MAVPLSSMIEHFLRRELRSVRLELEAYPQESLIWSLPPGLPNSGGTLALHLAGNLRHYVGAVLGGDGYVRDRDAEFARRDVPRDELLAQIAAADEAVRTVLPRLTEEQLARPFPEAIREHEVETGDFLIQLATHLAYHLGQLSYHRRVASGDSRGVGALASSELASARPIAPSTDA